jgi:hypothetical protein
MKTTNVLIKLMFVMMAMIMVTASAIGRNPAKALALDANNKKIQQQIAQKIVFPENCLIKGHDGESAELTFVLTEENKVDITNISCDCKELGDCIRKQLSDVYCKDVYHAYNQVYTIKIWFQLF